MKKKFIETAEAPKAIGAYSQGIIAGDFLFISGQIPLDPKTMDIVSPDFDNQVEQVICNLREIIEKNQQTLDHIVKITVYLKNLENFQSVNKTMEKHFNKPYPARAAVEVSRLPKDVQVEMDAIVYMG